MDWFIDPIKNHYFDFEGRATRKQFWMFVLFYILAAIVIAVVESMIGMEDILTSVYGLALLLPYLGLAARRLHDINKSGWWLLIGIVPVIGFIVLLIFYVKEGDAGANQYGPSPKSGDSDISANPNMGDVPRPENPPMNDVPQPPAEDRDKQQ